MPNIKPRTKAPKEEQLTEALQGELPAEEAVVSHTYVVAPRIRWQGMLENPLCSFWGQELSEVWSGTQVEPPKPRKPLQLFPQEMAVAPKLLRGWLMTP